MADDQNTIDGYQFVNCVSSGTHSQIWEVLEPGGVKPLVMKLLLQGSFEDKEHVATLKHEAKVQQSLEHPSFIPFHKLVANKKQAYILMDYFGAANVKIQFMNDIVSVQSRIRRLIEPVCIALGYMHDKGWVHRDIKPENILFNKAGQIKLIDFSLTVRFASGVSKLFAGKPKTIQGTRTYIAPETLLKKPPVPQTDMYSLGITMFELLTGQSPFTASSPHDLLNKHLKEVPSPPSYFNANVTPEMDQFVLRSLAKKPVKRFANMNEMLAEFRSLKVFKVDVLEIRAKAEQKHKEFAATGGDLSDGLALSSRDDALRDKSIPRPSRRRKRKPKPAPEPPQTAAPPPPAAFPQQPPPQPFPVQPQFVPPGNYQPGMVPAAPPPQQPMMPVAHAPQQAFPPQGIPVSPGFAGQPQSAAPMPQQFVPVPGVPPEQPVPQPTAVPDAIAHGTAPTSPEVLRQQQPPQSQPLAQPSAPPVAPPNDSRQPQRGDGDQILNAKVELQPQAPIPSDRHTTQNDNNDDLPLMEELPEIE